MRELEAREQPSLFKLHLTAGVKRLFGAALLRRPPGGRRGRRDGHERSPPTERLVRDRRVVILRWRFHGEMLLAGRIEGQEVLAFVEAEAPLQR